MELELRTATLGRIPGAPIDDAHLQGLVYQLTDECEIWWSEEFDPERGLLSSLTGTSTYHQARLLVLVDAFTRSGGKVDGLTKVAKLDFLLRYPTFLRRLADTRGIELPVGIEPTGSEELAVESRIKPLQIRSVG